MKEITLQDKTFTIQRFKGLKAILAIASLTKVMREVPDVFAQVLQDFQAKHKVKFDRTLAKIRYDIDDTEFAKLANDDGMIELYAPLAPNEQIMAAMPELLDRARKPMIGLLALMIMENDALRVADKEDRVDEELGKYYDFLLYECELDELAELSLSAYEVLVDQLQDKGDRLGKMFRALAKVFRMQLGQSTAPSLASTSTGSLEKADAVASEVLSQTTSKDESPGSSTDSLAPTGGPESTPSTLSPGVSSGV